MSYYVQFTYLINQLERLGILKSRIIYLLLKTTINWQFFPYWPYWSLPPGGLVSPSGGFASLGFDLTVPKNSQHHLADRNAICILNRSDRVWLCCLSSQFKKFTFSVKIKQTGQLIFRFWSLWQKKKKQKWIDKIHKYDIVKCIKTNLTQANYSIFHSCFD